MKTHFLASAIVCLLAMSGASAARAEYFYIGGGLGVANIDDLCQGASSEFCDDQGVMVRGFGGMRLNRFLALEVAFDFGGDFTTPGARAAGLDGDTNAGAFGLNLIGFLPLGERVSLLGGVSGAYSQASTKVNEYSYRNSSQDCDWEYDWYDDDWDYYCRNRSDDYDDDYRSDGSFAAGALVGVEVQLSHRLSLRAQAQRYFDVDGGLAFGARRDLDFVTLNVLFAFKPRAGD